MSAVSFRSGYRGWPTCGSISDVRSAASERNADTADRQPDYVCDDAREPRRSSHHRLLGHSRGSAVTENLFSIPGIGRVLTQAVPKRVQGWMFIMTTLMNVLLDPWVRYE